MVLINAQKQEGFLFKKKIISHIKYIGKRAGILDPTKEFMGNLPVYQSTADFNWFNFIGFLQIVHSVPVP